MTKKNSYRNARDAAYKKQKGFCFYCGLRMCRLGKQKSFRAKYNLSKKQCRYLVESGEHLIPKKDGGTYRRSNIVMACGFCNSSRFTHSRPNITVSEYKELVTTRMQEGTWHPSLIPLNEYGHPHLPKGVKRTIRLKLSKQ